MWRYRKSQDWHRLLHIPGKNHWKLLRNAVEHPEQCFHLRSQLCHNNKNCQVAPVGKMHQFLDQRTWRKISKGVITKFFIVLQVFRFRFCQLLMWGSWTSQVMSSVVTVTCYFMSAQYPKWWVKSVIIIVEDTDVLHSFLISLLHILPMHLKTATQA